MKKFIQITNFFLFASIGLFAQSPVLNNANLVGNIVGASRLDNGNYAVGGTLTVPGQSSTDLPSVLFFDKTGNYKNNVFGWDLNNSYDWYQMTHLTSYVNSVYVTGTLNISQASSIPPYIAKFSSAGMYFMKELQYSLGDITLNGITAGNGKLLVYGNNGTNGFYVELDTNGVVLNQRTVNFQDVVGACYGTGGAIYLALSNGSAELNVVKFVNPASPVFKSKFTFPATSAFKVDVTNTPVLLKESAVDGRLIVAAEVVGGSSSWERSVFLSSLNSATGVLLWNNLIGDNTENNGDDYLKSLNIDNRIITLGLISSNYGFGGSDVEIIRYDMNGTKQFAAALGGDKNETIAYVCPNGENYFIAGQTNSFDVSRSTMFSLYSNLKVPYMMNIEPYDSTYSLLYSTFSFTATAVTSFSVTDFDTDSYWELISLFNADIPEKKIFSNTLQTSTAIKKLNQLSTVNGVYLNTSFDATAPQNFFLKYNTTGSIDASKAYIYSSSYSTYGDVSFEMGETNSQNYFLRKIGTISLLSFTSKTFAPVKTLQISNTGNYTNYGVQYVAGEKEGSDVVSVGGVIFNGTTYNIFLSRFELNTLGTPKYSLAGTYGSKFIASINKGMSDVMYVKYSDNVYYFIDHSGTTINKSSKYTTSQVWSNEHIIRARDNGFILCHEIPSGIEVIKVTSAFAPSTKTVITGYSLADIKTSNDGYILIAAQNKTTKNTAVIKLDNSSLNKIWAKEYLSNFYNTSASVDVCLSTKHLDGFALSVLGEHNMKTYVSTILADNTGGTQYGCQVKDIIPSLSTTNSSTITTAAISLSFGTLSPTVSDGVLTPSLDAMFDYKSETMDLKTQAVAKDVSCNGMSDGAIDVSITEGTSPISVLWTKSGTSTTYSSKTVNSLTAGNYVATVSDAFGCIQTTSVSVGEPLALLSSVTTANVTCAGLANGGATANVKGGTPPYYYYWSNGLKTATIGNLYEGVFNVNIFDNNGCSAATQTVTITQPKGLVVKSVETINPRCSSTAATSVNYKKGSATIHCSDGKKPYQYKWDVDASGAKLAAPVFVAGDSIRSSLVSGSYTVTIQDACGQVLTSNFTLGRPDSLIISDLQVLGSKCNGDLAQINAKVTGGVAPFKYTFSNSNTVTGASASYKASDIDVVSYITATDSCGIVASRSVTVPAQPRPLVAASFTVPTVNCFGKYEATASVTVTGGTQPYQYMWSNGQTNQTAYGLPAGDNSVQIIDAHSCVTSGQVKILQKEKVSATSIETNVACYGKLQGSIVVTALGGKTPYRYKWSNSKTNVSSTASTLAAGQYMVTVSDACSDSVVLTKTLTQPTQLTAIFSAVANVKCKGANNGALQVSVSGGVESYGYKWSTAQTSSTVSALSPGTYKVSVFDACKDTVRLTQTITEPSALTTTLATTNILTCYTGNDASLKAVATGGTAPYVYNWSNGMRDSVCTGLSWGTHTVNVVDKNGCSDLKSMFISPPQQLSANISKVVNSDCAGKALGEIVATASNGKTPYSYLWSNNAITASSGLIKAGTYSVKVSDQCKDTIVLTQTIKERDPMSILLTKTDVKCFGESSGKASVQVLGGKPTYTYVWKQGTTTYSTSTIDGLKPGVYSVSVSDACAQTQTVSTTILQPTILSASVKGYDVTCFNTPTGAAKIQASGGVKPYSYIWGNGMRGDSITNILAGNYLSQVIDSNGCSVYKTASVLNKSRISASISSGSLSCYGAKGNVSVTASFGSGNYTYLWNTGNTTASLTNVAAGLYSVTVSDVTCKDSILLSSELTQPKAISLKIDSSNVSCRSKNDGTIQVQVSGGTLPYQYNWSTGEKTATISGLKAGIYSLVVTDNCALTANKSIVITQPDSLKITSFTKRDISCFGQLDGQATAVVEGGTKPYNYVWSNGQANATAVGLFAGTHILQVIDANACNTLNSVLITQPAKASGNIITVNNKCFGEKKGSISVQVTSGVKPYSYKWDVADSTRSELKNLSNGDYSVTVTDGCGYTFNLGGTISSDPAVTINGAVDDVKCAGNKNGAITLDVTGGTSPYLFNWNTNKTTSKIIELAGGAYSVTVTDGCGDRYNKTFLVKEPDSLSLTISGSNISCYGKLDGQATALVKGGTAPYNFAWENGQRTETAINLFAGKQTVYVLDGNACVASGSIVLTQPLALKIDSVIIVENKCYNGSQGQIAVKVKNGKLPYSFTWSNGITSDVVSNLRSGIYEVSVSDACNEVQVKSAIVPEPNKPSLTVSKTDIKCNGQANGQIESKISGGTAPYSFVWSNGKESQNIYGLTAKKYLVSVTDGCGINITDSATINEPEQIKINVTGQDVSCAGRANGKAWVSEIVGGKQPYTLSWNNNRSTDTIFSLTPGYYTAYVGDINGCNAQNSVVIKQPESLTASIATTSVKCFGKNEGTAILSAKGGLAPFAYTWSLADSTKNTVTNLFAGNYWVTVSDACGESINLPFTIDQPSALQVEKISNDVKCNNEHTASILLNVTGGLPDYKYSWSVSSSENKKELRSLAAGKYIFTVSDACNAQFIDSVTFANPMPITVKTQKSDTRCANTADGWAKLLADGGQEPYSYMWSFGSITDSVSNLVPNIYSYAVHDARGCTASGIVEIGKPDEIVVALTPNQTVCKADTGRIISKVTGGLAPYTYTWSNKTTEQNLTKVASGLYSVTVTDKNGCLAKAQASIPTFVKQYPICLVTVDSASKCNKVIWEKDRDTSIDAINIYAMFGQYRKIGSVKSSAQYSVYNDYMAKPRQASYQYAISTVDKCGNESGLSYSHSTMLMWSNYSTEPNKANIEWTPYIDESGDFKPDYYLIYKGNSYSNMTYVDKVPGSSTIFVDEHNDGARYYRVVFEKKESCVVTGLKSDTGPFSQSLSNMSEASLVDLVAANGTMSVTVAPNPAEDEVSISGAELEQVQTLQLTDSKGAKFALPVQNASATEIKLSVKGLYSGLYSVQVPTTAGLKTIKLMIE